MASLTGNQIDQTYPGLIKTIDNAIIGVTRKVITDGEGNSSTLSLGTTSASFAGDLDLTGATITGLPEVEAGLVAGTGADSMQSAASLTTVAASANAGSIAIGDGTVAGTGLTKSIAIGQNASAVTTFGTGSIAIGFNVKTVRDAGIAIGRDLNQALGNFDHFRPINIGSGGSVRGGDGIGIGTNINIQGTNSNDRIAIGTGATVTDVTGAVALGAGVTAATANTVSVKELETQTAGGGLTLKSADLTTAKITLTDANVLAIGGTNIPANDPVTATVINRFWSGTQAQYDALVTYNADTIYFIV